MSTNPYDICKVLVVGEIQVGKTSIVNQYVNREYHDDYLATQSVHPLVKTLDDQKITLQFWDMAGGIGESSREPFLKNARVVLFVYDVNLPPSFEAIETYRQKILSIGMLEGAITVLVGNKKDRNMSAEPAVDNRTASEYAKGKFDFFEEVSAKDAINIKGLFAKIVEKLAPKQSPRAYEKYKDRIESLSGFYYRQRHSCIRYPNEDRKEKKENALGILLNELMNGTPPATAVRKAEEIDEEVRIGKRTHKLLNEIETDPEFSLPTFK